MGNNACIHQAFLLVGKTSSHNNFEDAFGAVRCAPAGGPSWVPSLHPDACSQAERNKLYACARASERER